MRYPNLRYGNPQAFQHYAMSFGTTSQVARTLRRSEKSVKNWLTGKARVPWWVPEILRLKKLEHDQMVFQMTGMRTLARLGVVEDGEVIDAGHRFRSDDPPDGIDVGQLVDRRRQG